MSHHLDALPYERTGTRRRLVISGAHPGLVKAIEENFPDEHRQRIRTTNSLERFNQEIKRRTSILLGVIHRISTFPTTNSVPHIHLVLKII